MNEKSNVTWAFRRLGGMDQVTLETSGELSNLRELDPKLWATLSCPASGLEFDALTLTLLDEDKDGRIRIPEVLDAMDWLCHRISNPEEIVSRPANLPLASIRQDNPEGKKLYDTAITVLKNLGRQDASEICEDDVKRAASVANALLYNGDGIIPVHDDLDGDQKKFVDAALQTVGGETDACGATGITANEIDALKNALAEESAWRESVKKIPLPLGDKTHDAWNLLQKLRDKSDDYFLRCRMASFAPQSLPALNAEDVLAASSEGGLLENATLQNLPLSHVRPDAPFSFETGINPAWIEKIASFLDLCGPLLPDTKSMDEKGWKKLQEDFAPYGDALAKRPVPAPSGSAAPAAPLAFLDTLSSDDIAALCGGAAAEQLKGMMEQDLSVPSASSDIAELEKLVLYYCNMHRLLMNFVSFHDFYSLKKPATFQAGTLFIDGRSCRLCLPVANVDKHSGMAAFSQICLLYCACTRTVDNETKSMTVVAGMTAGSDTFLREGRNGVYVDDDGNDWDATIVQVVRNPISLKQAVWSPYVRISQMIGETVTKFASDKEARMLASASKRAAETAAAPAKAAGTPFDIGKSVGIFAAVGIALGAIGTAVGSIASMIMSLHWWQFPLLFLALFLCISGPAVFLAWLKLRKRTLGPLLEASGWAVNSQLPINQMLGRALTKEAVLPKNSKKAHLDPLRDKSPVGKIIFAACFVLILLLGYFGIKYSAEITAFFNKNVPAEQQAAPEQPAPAKVDAPAEAPAQPAEAAPQK